MYDKHPLYCAMLQQWYMISLVMRGSYSKNRRGFTLAELLIAVAIIAVLVGISIPIFNTQLEKSRKALDMSNARNAEAVLAAMVNDGTADLTAGTNTGGTANGIWMIVRRDSSVKILGYNTAWKTNVFCGADRGVTVDGKASYSDWSANENSTIRNTLKQSGIAVDDIKTESKDSSKDTGWDWYAVEVAIVKDGSSSVLTTRIYSGFSGESAGYSTMKKNTNIEKAIEGDTQ